MLFLAGFVDDEGRALGFLLGDLLGFDGGGEFGGEGEVLVLTLDMRVGRWEGGSYGQGDVVEHDIEPRSSPHKIIPHEPRHVLTLRNQLTGIELRDHALEHLVDDTRQHALVVVGTERAVDLWQGVDARPREHTAGDVDHLQVLGAGEGGHISRLRAHVVGDGRLEPGDAQVRAFAVYFFLHAADAGVLYCAVASVDWGMLVCCVLLLIA